MATKSVQSYAAFTRAAERERSDNDSDSTSVEIIENDENNKNDENEPDVVVLGSVSASSVSSSTKRHVNYLNRYRLLLPPADPEMSHDRRARVSHWFFVFTLRPGLNERLHQKDCAPVFHVRASPRRPTGTADPPFLPGF
jgi:hypothetical protein